MSLRTWTIRACAGGMVAVMASAGAAYVESTGAWGSPKLPQARAVSSVPGVEGVSSPAVTDSSAKANMGPGAQRKVNWPQPATRDIDLSGSQAFGPVSVSAVGRRAGRARVEVLDRTATVAVGRSFAMRVRLVEGSGPIEVKLDYREFADAYGGGWSRRLRLVELPECAFTTPESAGCQQRELAGSNDPDTGTVRATLDTAAEGAIVALAAAPSSDGGTYAATPLQATSSWRAGEQSGDFTWSYPLRLPPGLGGPEPDVGFVYSSQSQDGKTAATNAQPSWVGDGFDYTPGQIERSYKACVDDGKTGVGDLCWGNDNAILSMPGHGGQLIQVSTSPDVWKLESDDGTKVERLTNTVNGDNNNEYWKVTTTDGTRYFFGLNRLPGYTSNKETKSAFTVPVYGNNAGEPCYNAAGFTSSYCTQAYKWNLDYVVDPHGNTMSLWYFQEANHYARNVTNNTVSAYVRGGSVDHIDYGTRQDATGNDNVFTTSAPARVSFGLADRCVTPGATCTAATPSNWPDVPWDQQCDSTTDCTGRYTPAFYTQKRLSTVTTQVWNGSQYSNVERWTFNQVFKDPGDGHAKTLWLSSISRVGLNGGQNTPMPNVSFGAVQLNNRVDKSTTKSPIIRFRVNSITNESGGVISVNYLPAECVLGSVMPTSADQNSKRCYPVYWTPYGASAATFDWFHKYVVSSVTLTDPVGGAPAESFAYTYTTAGPMWHYDTSEMVKPSHKSWGQWRGYRKVRVTHGSGTSQQQSDTIYYQGMHGDKLSSGTRTVTIPADADFGGAAVNDEDWLAGQVREEITYNGLGDAGAVVSKTLTLPWSYGPTATRTRNGVTTNAYLHGTKQTTTLMALDGSRGWRKTQSTNTFDVEDSLPNPIGLVIRVDNANDVASATDNMCIRLTYATNLAANLRTALTQKEVVSVACGTPPDRSKDVITDNRMWYDGATSFDKTISKGDITRNELLADWNGGTPKYLPQRRSTYDSYGRLVTWTDALDHETKLEYTPATGGPLTATTLTDVKTWQTKTTFDPGFGNKVSVVDVNNKRTDFTYDGLGMATAVWLPGRNKASQTANQVFTYTLRNSGGPTAVSASILRPDGNGHNVSWTLYDGMLRERQSQVAATGGGRVIIDLKYDSAGQRSLATMGYFNASSPGSTLFTPTGAVAGQSLTTYDRAGRVTASIFQKNGLEHWRTSTYYGGDHVDTTMPAGGTASSVWTDARGLTTKMVQYHGTSPSGAADTTTYDYYPGGKLKTSKDAAANVWSYQYDQLGRQTQAIDPDKGKVDYTYDDLGQLRSTKDATNSLLTYDYDVLGRKKTLHHGEATGPKLAEWTYDSVVKGRAASAIRYDINGNAYTTTVTGYNDSYQATGTTITIPAVEGALAGTYTSSTTFNANGSPATTVLPGVGGLVQETLTFGYDNLGHVSTLSGLDTYVTGSAYDSLGRLGTRTTSNGQGKTLTQVWNYEEGTNRLLEHGTLDEAAGVVYQDNWYDYDLSGNVLSIKDMMAQYGGTDDNQCLKYDYYSRLAKAWTPSNGACGTLPTQWSSMGGPAPYWQEYTYDDLTSNRKTKVDYSASGSSTRVSEYPPATTPRPHAVSKVVTGPQEDTFLYDPAGNTVERSLFGKPTQALKWTPEGRLESVEDTGGKSTYVYDASGNRLIARTPSGNTLYLGDQEVKAVGSVTTAKRSYGGFAVRTTSGGLYWTVNDQHGTNDLIFKAADLTKTQRRMTPFGDGRTGNPATWPTTDGFVGGTADGTGLTHLGAREYDPATGRFISVDPLMNMADPQTWDGYGYSHNNPATHSDPSGMADGFRPYRIGTIWDNWTYMGYHYYARLDTYRFCRSDGACLGEYDRNVKWHYYERDYLSFIRIKIDAIGPYSTYVPPAFPDWGRCIAMHPYKEKTPEQKTKEKTPVYELYNKPNCTKNCTASRGYCINDNPECLRKLYANTWSGDQCELYPDRCNMAEKFDVLSTWAGWLGPVCLYCDIMSLAFGGTSAGFYLYAGDGERGANAIAKTVTGAFVGRATVRAGAQFFDTGPKNWFVDSAGTAAGSQAGDPGSSLFPAWPGDKWATTGVSITGH